MLKGIEKRLCRHWAETHKKEVNLWSAARRERGLGRGRKTCNSFSKRRAHLSGTRKGGGRGFFISSRIARHPWQLRKLRRPRGGRRRGMQQRASPSQPNGLNAPMCVFVSVGVLGSMYFARGRRVQRWWLCISEEVGCTPRLFSPTSPTTTASTDTVSLKALLSGGVGGRQADGSHITRTRPPRLAPLRSEEKRR